jgi:hypothetical protein
MATKKARQLNHFLDPPFFVVVGYGMEKIWISY